MPVVASPARKWTFFAMGCAVVLYLASVIYLSNISTCASAVVLIINGTSQKATTVKIRNNEWTVWKGRVGSYSAKRLTVPIPFEGLINLDATLEDGTRVSTEYGGYVTSINSATFVFLIEPDQVKRTSVYGSLVFSVDADGSWGEVLE